MSEPFLHHYPESPFAEKTRLIFGLKGLRWRSVIIPPVMPKPDLIALTGGYRKTPVLQLGRDIYCDTALIAQVLDRLQPAPPLIPATQAASCDALTYLGDHHLFLAVIPVIYQPAGLEFVARRMGSAENLQRFQKDRAALFSGGSVQRPGADFSLGTLPQLVASLESQLAARPFLLGSEPSLADLACYHPVWFVLGNAGVRDYFDDCPNILDWSRRVAAIGHGSPQALDAADAIAQARDSAGWEAPLGAPLDVRGVALGATVRVAATDYGCDPMEGQLVIATTREIAVRRRDARAGETVVHVPRSGFKVTAV